MKCLPSLLTARSCNLAGDNLGILLIHSNCVFRTRLYVSISCFEGLPTYIVLVISLQYPLYFLKFLIVSVKIFEIMIHDFLVYSISFFVFVILNSVRCLDMSKKLEPLNSFFNLFIPFRLM